MTTSSTACPIPLRQPEDIAIWKRCNWRRTRSGLFVWSPERSSSISPFYWSWRPPSKSVVSENDAKGKKEREVGGTICEGTGHRTKLSLWTCVHSILSNFSGGSQVQASSVQVDPWQAFHDTVMKLSHLNRSTLKESPSLIGDGMRWEVEDFLAILK